MKPVRSSFFGFDLEHDSLPAVAAGEPLDLPADIVLPPSPTTRTLARLMIRRPVRDALDLGTGCGALALLASGSAEQVVATDVNPRALAYTVRNAAANDVRNVRCVAGPLVEPVAGERFDLVVGNLPFVISPMSTLTFRDGIRSDNGAADLSEAAVASAARVLEPGGAAQFLVNWVVTDRAHPYDEPVRWVRATGHTGLVLLHSLTAPHDYVASWARSVGDDRAAWLRYLERRGAAAIANGAVTIRRESAPPSPSTPTISTARMTTSPRGTGGDQVERILDARRPSDAEILTTRPLLPTPARWERVTSPAGTDGTRRADHLRLVAANTCGVTATVPVGLAPIVRRFDGTTTIDEAVSDAIDEAGAHARTEYDITAATVAVVRHLVMTGLASLTPG